MEIKIKYFNEDYPRLEKIEKGDWIDLRVDRLVSLSRFGEIENIRMDEHGKFNYRSGDVIKVGLGVAMELPDGYEAIVAPRSSTFKHWGLLQTNSWGVIDNSYNGNDDEWLVEFVAAKGGTLRRFDRVCQFRLQENQPEFKIKEVKSLKNKNRGGYGSTGRC